MSSSITCCTHPELVPDNRLYSDNDRYGSSVNGHKSDMTVKRGATTRRKREFTPEDQKDDTYWLKRSRNNESAKRSRLRRRMEESLLEARAVELLRENEKLKAALSAIHYNIGVKNHFDATVGHSVSQGPYRDTYMSSRASCLASLTDFPDPLPGTDGLSRYSFSCRGQMRLGPTYDPGMEKCTSANVLRAQVLDNIQQMDRSVHCHLGIPAFGDRNSPSNLCVPECQREAVQSYSSPNMNLSHNYSGHYDEGDMVAPGFTRPQTNCGPTHIGHDPYIQGNGPVIIQDKEGNSTKSKEPERVLPLLPHKLRYKVSKAWREHN
ncbi:NFIL3 like protein-like [Hoplias malabaricus]|uniref:NFIL3 like protein-like n=1 Tax=Hoplias malabaricus TaxID=27720 RepID=UPI0034619DC7